MNIIHVPFTYNLVLVYVANKVQYSG